MYLRHHQTAHFWNFIRICFHQICLGYINKKRREVFFCQNHAGNGAAILVETADLSEILGPGQPRPSCSGGGFRNLVVVAFLWTSRLSGFACDLRAHYSPNPGSCQVSGHQVSKPCSARGRPLSESARSRPADVISARLTSDIHRDIQSGSISRGQERKIKTDLAPARSPRGAAAPFIAQSHSHDSNRRNPSIARRVLKREHGT